MPKSIIILSVCVGLTFLGLPLQADSILFPPYDPLKKNIALEKNKEIPLIFIKELKFYNGKTSSSYAKKIEEFLSLEPSVVITDEELLADYFLFPELLLSKAEKINAENICYSISVRMQLKTPKGVIINTEQKNRYIIITKNDDEQKIAQKLLLKLLEEAAVSLVNELKTE